MQFYSMVVFFWSHLHLTNFLFSKNDRGFPVAAKLSSNPTILSSRTPRISFLISPISQSPGPPAVCWQVPHLSFGSAGPFTRNGLLSPSICRNSIPIFRTYLAPWSLPWPCDHIIMWGLSSSRDLPIAWSHTLDSPIVLCLHLPFVT